MARVYAKWKLENPITVAKFRADLADGSIGIDAVLADTGKYIQTEMKAITEKSDASGRLTGSITWQTAKQGSNIGGSGSKKEDQLERPKEPNLLIVGSAAPHAKFREEGSGVHGSWVGHEEFVELMKEWCRTRFQPPFNPDSGNPEDKELFHNILKAIRNSDTEGKPFVEPNVPKILPFAIKRFRIALNKYFRATRGKK